MSPQPAPPSRRGNDFSQELARKGWYHSFELPDGTRIDGYHSSEFLRTRWSHYPIPASLAGKRVLDIGAWDGWFTFEAERRGAEVVAMDCVEIPNFLDIHRRLSSKAAYRILDFYDLPSSGLGAFDIVFFLGVLYHLKHPLLALEIVCALTTETAIVESFVTDPDTWRDHQFDVPSMEFYETDELGNQLDNWIGPTVGCLMAMCRAAGFARVDFLYTSGSHAGVACHRQWEPVPAQPSQDPPELLSVENARTRGVNFRARQEEYISCWFRTPTRPAARGQLRLEAAGFGVPALWVKQLEDGRSLANFRLPPGLTPGWKTVRLRCDDSAFGREFRIAIDVPLVCSGPLRLHVVCDGATWTRNEVRVDGRGFLSCWASGLAENADRDNVRAVLGSTPLLVDYAGQPDAEGLRQINAFVPGDIPKGGQPFHIECAGASSDIRVLKIL